MFRGHTLYLCHIFKYIYIGALWIDEFKRKWVLLFKARRDALEVDVIWLHNESLALIKAAALRAGSP